jgi:hypothetical protein
MAEGEVKQGVRAVLAKRSKRLLTLLAPQTTLTPLKEVLDKGSNDHRRQATEYSVN